MASDSQLKAGLDMLGAVAHLLGADNNYSGPTRVGSATAG